MHRQRTFTTLRNGPTPRSWRTIRTTGIFAVLAGPIVTACAVEPVPEDDDVEDVGQSSASLRHTANVRGGSTDIIDPPADSLIGSAANPGTAGAFDPGGVRGDTLPPLDPTPDGPDYVPRGRLVRITSDELNFALLFVLGQSRIVVDTLGTSPTLSAPYYHCTYPNREIREALIADCKTLPKSYWAECFQSVNAEYPNTRECGLTMAAYHSYFDFGPTAERFGARDVGFEIDEITRDSWGPGSTIVNLNYIRQTIDANTTKAWFSPEPNYKGAANFSLTLVSNQPTIDCRHTVFACPDIELTNMKITASLSHIKPVADDPTKLGYDHVNALFTFDRNLNNVPDGFVTVFLDIDALIRNNVQQQVKKALELTASREAISKALTELARRNAVTKNGSVGIDWFYGAFAQADGSLMVDYQPCPRVGCRIRGRVGPVVALP